MISLFRLRERKIEKYLENHYLELLKSSNYLLKLNWRLVKELLE